MSKPNLAIMMELSKRRKKKMAKGGAVNESAASEHRPMPEEMDKDSAMVSRNEASMSRPAIPRPRIQAIKHPKMVPSTGFSSRLMNHEDDLEAYAKPQKHAGMSEDKSPAEEEIMADHFAEGGQVAPPDKDKAKDFKKGFESGGPSVSEMIDGITSVFKADGGEIEEDHDASMAAAIMAKRRRMAEGGQVDIDSNAEEQPNSFYEQNEDAALKENYDSDMDDVSQPMDSNEHGHMLSDEDAHDMVSQIRRKMMSKRKT